jgi:hypothetical protein
LNLFQLRNKLKYIKEICRGLCCFSVPQQETMSTSHHGKAVVALADVLGGIECRID